MRAEGWGRRTEGGIHLAILLCMKQADIGSATQLVYAFNQYRFGTSRVCGRIGSERSLHIPQATPCHEPELAMQSLRQCQGE